MDQLQKQPRLSHLTCALKLLLPSWNFFNDFSDVPRLEYRVLDDSNEPIAWLPVHCVENTSGLWRVLIDPSGNLELLEKSLIGRAATELGELSDIDRDTFELGETGSMVLRIARSRIRTMTDRGSLSDNPLFQCRIRMSGTTASDELTWVSSYCSLRD